MTDKAPVCIACTLATSKVVRFFPAQNGYAVPYGHNGALHGDLYECRICGMQIVVDWGKDPDYPSRYIHTMTGEHRISVPRDYIAPGMIGVTDSDGAKRLAFSLWSEGYEYGDPTGFIKNVHIPDHPDAITYACLVSGANWAQKGHWYPEESE